MTFFCHRLGFQPETEQHKQQARSWSKHEENKQRSPKASPTGESPLGLDLRPSPKYSIINSVSYQLLILLSKIENYSILYINHIDLKKR